MSPQDLSYERVLGKLTVRGFYGDVCEMTPPPGATMPYCWKTRMVPPSENTIVLSPVMEDLPRLMAWLEAFAETCELAPVDNMALELCAEELFTNTVRHGQDMPGQAPVNLTLARNAEILRLVYSDAGPAFDTAAAAALAPSHEGADVATKAPGGLGLHFLARTMHDIRYERTAGRNVLTLERTLGSGKLAH